jgi:hypothetical protein
MRRFDVFKKNLVWDNLENNCFPALVLRLYCCLILKLKQPNTTPAGSCKEI